MNDFLDSIPLFFEVYVLIILVVGMAWIWRKLKDIETHLKERALVQEKHNEHVSS